MPRQWLPQLEWAKVIAPIFAAGHNFKSQAVVPLDGSSSRIEPSAPLLNLLTRIASVGTILIAIGPVVADDDRPTTRVPPTRTPNGQTFTPRSRNSNPQTANARAARSRNADSQGAALPRIVTPSGGRRTVTLEGVSRPGIPTKQVRPAIVFSQIDPASPWHFEKLILKDETVYQGLLLRTTPGDEGEAEFAHIMQQPGKPMSAIVRVIPRIDVKRFVRLPPDQRDVLVARFHFFRRRATIEARNIETITLLPQEGRDGTRLIYKGQWFQLESSADDESTRRCVVRIEQMFAGFRQLLPPRVEPRDQLKILLFGSMDEFRDELSRWNLDIENPAFFSTAKNMIVAGGDLSRFGEQLARIRDDHEKVLRDFNELERVFQQRLATISQKMVAGGFQRQEIKTELALRRTTWREQRARLQRDITEANRRNDTAFAKVTNRMLKRLYHEGFHAYLENFVFPHREFHVDRWLNEGLAQIFENGRFDVEVLRLDAPDPVLLAKLQQDLNSQNRMSLIQFLTAPDSNFLVHHAHENSDRRYLYAWGLAYFLFFERDLLDGDALTNYVLPLAKSSPELARFEELVREPIDDFEIRWRDYICKLQGPR